MRTKDTIITTVGFFAFIIFGLLFLQCSASHGYVCTTQIKVSKVIENKYQQHPPMHLTNTLIGGYYFTTWVPAFKKC